MGCSLLRRCEDMFDTWVPLNSQMLNPLLVATSTTISISLLFGAAFTCSFLKVRARSGEILQILETGAQELRTVASMGVMCDYYDDRGQDSGFYDLRDDDMWKLSRIFFGVAVGCGSTTTLMAWIICSMTLYAVDDDSGGGHHGYGGSGSSSATTANNGSSCCNPLMWFHRCLCFCHARLLPSTLLPTRSTWQAISVLSALSAVWQVPIFLMFETAPCTQYRKVQSCEFALGGYLAVLSVVGWMMSTLLTQCLDPPRWTDNANLDQWRVLSSAGGSSSSAGCRKPSSGVSSSSSSSRYHRHHGVNNGISDEGRRRHRSVGRRRDGTVDGGRRRLLRHGEPSSSSSGHLPPPLPDHPVPTTTSFYGGRRGADDDAATDTTAAGGVATWWWSSSLPSSETEKRGLWSRLGKLWNNHLGFFGDVTTLEQINEAMHGDVDVIQDGKKSLGRGGEKDGGVAARKDGKDRMGQVVAGVVDDKEGSNLDNVDVDVEDVDLELQIHQETSEGSENDEGAIVIVGIDDRDALEPEFVKASTNAATDYEDDDGYNQINGYTLTTMESTSTQPPPIVTLSPIAQHRAVFRSNDKTKEAPSPHAGINEDRFMHRRVEDDYDLGGIGGSHGLPAIVTPDAAKTTIPLVPAEHTSDHKQSPHSRPHRPSSPLGSPQHPHASSVVPMDQYQDKLHGKDRHAEDEDEFEVGREKGRGVVVVDSASKKQDTISEITMSGFAMISPTPSSDEDIYHDDDPQFVTGDESVLDNTVISAADDDLSQSSALMDLSKTSCGNGEGFVEKTHQTDCTATHNDIIGGYAEATPQERQADAQEQSLMLDEGGPSPLKIDHEEQKQEGSKLIVPYFPSLNVAGKKSGWKRRRHRFFNGYALMDDMDSDWCFPVSPPLEIFTFEMSNEVVQQQDPLQIEASNEQEQKLIDAWVALHSLTRPIVRPSSDEPEPRLHFSDDSDEEDDEEEEDGLVPDDARGTSERSDDSNWSPTRRGKRTLKRKRRRRRSRRTFLSVGSIASTPSLLDYTIEEETAADLVDSASDQEISGLDNNSSVINKNRFDPYTTVSIKRSHSAPNFNTGVQLLDYDEVFALTGLDDTRSAAIWRRHDGVVENRKLERRDKVKSDGASTGASPSSRDRLKAGIVTKAATILTERRASRDGMHATATVISVGSEDNDDDTGGSSSNPGSRARLARIARLQREWPHRRRARSLDPPTPMDVEATPRRQRDETSTENQQGHIDEDDSPSYVVESLDVQLAQLLRPDGVEYGSDEASL